MLYKRPNSRFWWCKFIAPDGNRVQKSTKAVDKQLAREYEDRYRAELWRIFNLGDKPRKTWKQAVVRWLQESKDKKSIDKDKIYLNWLDPFLANLYLDEITRDLLTNIGGEKLNTGVSNATVNRHMEVIRSILNRAEREWEWIGRAPAIRMLKEPKRRIRWITLEEAQRLLALLPSHTKAMAKFALATGLRESNVTRLEWSQVDLTRRVAWIHDDQSKSGHAIGVPLNSEAILVLREQVGNHDKYVFTYQGRPIKKANTQVWRRALKQAGIKDFRWHDLRHTWASWHVQNGTPIHVLQEMGGWSDIRMVQRYAHLAPEHLASYAEAICKPRAVVATLLATPGIRNKKAATG